MKTEKKKHADILMKMMFHNKKIKTPSPSRGGVQNRKLSLSLCTMEEIMTKLKNEGVIDLRRVSVKKDNQNFIKKYLL